MYIRRVCTSGGYVHQEGMYIRGYVHQGVCTSGGMYIRRVCTSGGYVHQGVCTSGEYVLQGVCTSGGMYIGGYAAFHGPLQPRISLE